MTGPRTKSSRGTNKQNIGSPIVIKSFSPNTAGKQHSSIEKFLHSTSAEEQLGILKTIIEEQKDSVNDEVVRFLAIVFYEAPAKHPVKCFLSRHVTKCDAIQQSFINSLTAHIASELQRNHNLDAHGSSTSTIIEYYSETVSKIWLCIENFPIGAIAVERIGVKLLTQHLFYDYFRRRENLRECPSLSPTKKNEMFTLEHTMLRIMVHVMQKLRTNESACMDWVQSTKGNGFANIMHYINIFIICDEEVPMDTKALSGLLMLAVEDLRFMLDNERDAWIFLLETCISYSKDSTRDLGYYFAALRHKIGRLAVYSAIAATVPMSSLQHPSIMGPQTAIILRLLEQLLSYANGTASEPAVTVCVSRALLQLSRQLAVLQAAPGAAVTSLLLAFVWRHLDYHLDSVRHLANQILAACLQYCADLDKQGEHAPLEGLVRSVRALAETRSFYWAVGGAVPALGPAPVLADLCGPRDLLRAAATPHLQVAASAAIVAVISGGACAGLTASDVFETWVRPALASLAALQAALPAAIVAQPALVQHIASAVEGSDALLCARVAPACRAWLTQRAVRAAALHTQHETRILALSLVAESERSTAGVTRAELDSVLWWLRFNLACTRPGFRSALVANVAKLLKRLEDSHRALSRLGDTTDHYGAFLLQLRALCGAAALRGASHGRRSTALQLLAGARLLLPHVTRTWTTEEVETLVVHLDDNYDTNKQLALQLLEECPLRLLEDCSRSLTLEAAVRSAAPLRAACGAGAASKLRLLLARLPHRVAPQPHDTTFIKDIKDEKLRGYYVVLNALLRQLRGAGELEFWREAARGGAAGSLRALADMLRHPYGAEVDWQRPPWTTLAIEVIEACINACDRAAPVVANCAPEGYLPVHPLDMEEGPAVTSQMVLVCAWRTVKEAAAVLGSLTPLVGDYWCSEAGRCLLGLLLEAMHRGAVEQAALGLTAIAHACWCSESRAHLPRYWLQQVMTLVARGAPHATRRGAGLPAAIQALVSSQVSATGQADCFNGCMAELLKIASADRAAASADRAAASADRADASADQAGASAGDADAVARRTLAANILRALFRHTSLEKVSQAQVAAGLRLALHGFEAVAWPERTAMSLLFCALCVRVFGVTRSRGATLHARNTLPAALFAQRYPGTYDLMLSKLQEFSPSSAAGPSVLPVLLLLSRLYPAAAEGAASSLKLSAFVPLVLRCACAAELRIRRVAARALPTILSPTEHFSYVEKLFSAICGPKLLHNHWHGALLALSSLLERMTLATPNLTPIGTYGTPTTTVGPKLAQNPESLTIASKHQSASEDKSMLSEPQSISKDTQITVSEPQVSQSGSPTTLSTYISRSMTALAQAAGDRPCYVVAKEYVNVLNLLIWKFPELVPRELLPCIRKHLDDILFSSRPPGADRELCLADCTLLYYILLHKEKQTDQVLPFITRTLRHPCYEVVLSTLDYLLIQNDSFKTAETDTESCNIRRHLLSIRDISFQNSKTTPEYKNILTQLREQLHDEKMYRECRITCLKLLSVEENTQTLILKEMPQKVMYLNNGIVRDFVSMIQNSHKDGKHMLLESLMKFTRNFIEKNEDFTINYLLDVCKVIYDCCSAENSDETRMVVVEYFELYFEMEKVDFSKFHLKFAYDAYVVSSLVTLIEDDDDVIRQRAADVIMRAFAPEPASDDDEDGAGVLEDVTSEDEKLVRLVSLAARDNGGSVIASAAGSVLRWHVGRAHGRPMLLLLALLDFRAEVQLTDQLTEECRVFDQGERYNISLDESAWTAACADKFIQISRQENHEDLIQLALSLIHERTYSGTFRELCNDNVKLFEKMARGELVPDETVNPKIEILVRKLQK